MNKLYIVERKIEDYPGKWDIDILLVSAPNGDTAKSRALEKNGGEKDRVTYTASLILDDNGSPATTESSIYRYIGDRVLERPSRKE